MSENNEPLAALRARFPDAILSAEEVKGEYHLEAAPDAVTEVCSFLRADPSFACDYPADLAARDTGDAIRLWYRLVSMTTGRTVLLHVSLPRENPVVASVTPIWVGMNWHERECFDLFGVHFPGHPDEGNPENMRILMPEDWVGHPFRKDYEPVFSDDPLSGPQRQN